MSLIEKECPMCGRITYMKITKKQENEWTDYICYGGKIQDKLKSFDKFGREFVKTGYCPECQSDLFDGSPKDPGKYFYEDDLREDVMREFYEKTKGMNPEEAIHSKHADMLSDNEKLVYMYDLEIEE